MAVIGAGLIYLKQYTLLSTCPLDIEGSHLHESACFAPLVIAEKATKMQNGLHCNIVVYDWGMNVEEEGRI